MPTPKPMTDAKRTSVRGRIALGFGVVIVILLTVAGAAVWLAREHRASLAEAERDTQQFELLEEVRSASTSQLTITLLYVTTGDELALANLSATEQKALAAVSGYMKLAEEGGEADELQAFRTLIRDGLAITATWNQAITLRSEGDTAGALALVSSTQEAMQAVLDEFDALSAQEGAEVASVRSQAATTADVALWMLVSAGTIGLFAAVCAGWFVSRSVLLPITSLEEAARSVSAGDLDARAPEHGPRELAAVGAAFNEMTEALLDASQRRELEAERERAHRELAEAHSRLEETTSRLNGVLASIDDVIYAVTPNTFQVLYINEGANNLYGRSASDFKENSFLWMDVTHPEDRERAMGLGKLVREHGYAEDEYRIVRPDGEVRWLRARVRLVTDDEGIPVRIDGINTDITARREAEEALTDSEARWRSLVENTPDFIITMDRDGKILMINRVAEGYDIDSVIGSDGYQFVEEQHRDELRNGVQRAFEALQTTLFENSTVMPDGSRRWYLSRVVPVMRDGEPVAATVIASDITDQKIAEQALRESEKRFRALIQNAQDVVTVLGPDGTIQFESPSLETTLGYAPEELVGKKAFDYIDPEDLGEVAQKIAAALQSPGEPQTVQFRFKHNDGSWRYLEAVGCAVEGESDMTIIVNSRDVTDRKEAEAEMAHLAYHDPLTHLPNRALFEDRANVALAQAERHGRTLGIVSIDLDRLKEVNDTYGHPVGDGLLQSVAERLTATLRDGDTVARVGGDEFLTILTHCESAGDCEAVASRIVEAFRKPFAIEGIECEATASVGLSIFPDDGRDLRTLVKCADAAMYQAKQGGRNGYRVYRADADAQPASAAPGDRV